MFSRYAEDHLCNDDTQRLMKMAGAGSTTTTTLYIGNWYEVTNGVATKYYYFGAQRVAMKQASAVTYLHGDHLGSTSATSGAINSSSTYYPFGAVRSGTLPTDYTFTGQKRDNEANLMFYNARYYDAGIGRFTQADTLVPNLYNPQSLNRYAYVLNNPVKYVDPTGHRTCDYDICDGSEETRQHRNDLMKMISEYGALASGDFSNRELRAILSMLKDFAAKAGSIQSAYKAIHGVVFFKDTTRTLKGTQQLWNVIYLDQWVFDGSEAATKRTLLHELAHYWEWAASDPLTQIFNMGNYSFAMSLILSGEDGPTDYARTFPIRERWAESVLMFVYPEYADVLNGAPSEKGVVPRLGPLHWKYVSSKFKALQ